jgi:hypothetical protein
MNPKRGILSISFFPTKTALIGLKPIVAISRYEV